MAEQESLFAATVDRPLADRMRPVSLDEIVGQEQLLGPEGPLRRMIDSGHLSSFILWGPPGQSAFRRALRGLLGNRRSAPRLRGGRETARIRRGYAALHR